MPPLLQKLSISSLKSSKGCPEIYTPTTSFSIESCLRLLQGSVGSGVGSLNSTACVSPNKSGGASRLCWKPCPNFITSSKKEKKILHCVECNEKMYLRPSDKKKFCSLQCKDLARDKGFFKGKSGGMRIGAGRAKSGWYKGIFCNSSYELAWVIYSLDNNVKFKRNTIISRPIP